MLSMIWAPRPPEPVKLKKKACRKATLNALAVMETLPRAERRAQVRWLKAKCRACGRCELAPRDI
jgi:hypothetical protein